MSDERLKIEALFKAEELATLDHEDHAYIEDYFRQFLPLGENGDGLMIGAKCRCGKPLTGFLGTFTYGIVHGEGWCAACKWPCIADHYVKDGAGAEILCLRRYVLQIHPSLVAAPHGTYEPVGVGASPLPVRSPE